MILKAAFDFRIKQLLLFFIVSVFALGCGSLTQNLLKDPTVSINTLNVTNISLKDLSLELEIDVTNPNPIPITLSQINYQLKFSGEPVTSGVFEKGIDIPANGSNKVIVPFTFTYNALGTLISNMLQKTIKRDYELTGTTKLGIFSIPFAKKGELKLK